MLMTMPRTLSVAHANRKLALWCSMTDISPLYQLHVLLS